MSTQLNPLEDYAKFIGKSIISVELAIDEHQKIFRQYGSSSEIFYISHDLLMKVLSNSRIS